jgi:hypothetical protein
VSTPQFRPAYRPPYTVVGHKGGYLSELAAIKAAKPLDATVTDADGKVVWVPAAQRNTRGVK